jgi:23S rRNA (cytosine1962-C5)-methyltransferase
MKLDVLMTTELWLRKGADRRLRGGHCWIYSNEIDTSRAPLSAFTAGDIVSVLSSSGDALGSAYMEPQSLICARLFSRQGAAQFDQAFCQQKVAAALALRQRFFEQPYYRLIYGDSDGLSGVVVDRFGDFLVLQLNTAGIERHQQALLQALVDCINPAGILLRSDSRARREQGLPDQVEVVHGQVPDMAPLVENGVQFEAPLKSGQKTGWFYDHRRNRLRLQSLSRDRRVLDVYSYMGGWGVQAAVAGAAQVCCVDSSEPALAGVAHNAALNGVQDRVSTLAGRADQVMEELRNTGERFDIVVLDPPAFIPRRRDLGKGRKAYRRINEMAMGLLSPGGVLVSASCSMHLAEADLLDLMAAAGQRSNCDVQVTEMGGQAADHPIHPAIAETRYLKAAFAVINPAG